MSRPYPFLRRWLLPFVRSRIWTIRGLENLPTSGGYILAPNHQSWIDSALLAAAIYRRLEKELRFVSQSTKYPWLGALPIPAGDRSKVLDAAVAALERGHPVVIFPEGNSNTKQHLRQPKTGVARLAVRAGLPVVPVGIRGSTGVNALAAALWFFSIWRGVHLRFGPAMVFPRQGLTGQDDAMLEQVTNNIMHQVSELSGKPMTEEEALMRRRGFLWFLAWRVFRPLVQWRVRVYGAQYLPDHGPFIVAANHSSYFDAPALSMAVFHATGLPLKYPTKQSVGQAFRKLGGRGLLRVLGMVPLDNADKSKVLDPAIAALRLGGVLGIFPEGTRNKPAINPRWATEHLKAKTGAVRLALATNAPIIPAAIRAPRGWSVSNALLNSLEFWKFTHVTFGPPVELRGRPTDLAAVTKNDLDQLSRQVMRRISTLTGLTYPY